MKKILLFALMGVFAVGGTFVMESRKARASDKIDVLFFYGTGCGHCAAVKPTIQKFEEEHEDDVNVHWYDVYVDREANTLFSFYADKYNIASRGVPTLIIGDKVLQGDTPIESGINSALFSCAGDCVLKIDLESALAEVRGNVENALEQPNDKQQEKTDGSEVPIAIEAGLTSEVNLTNKIILSIIGALMLIGIGIFVVGRSKKGESEK